MDAMLSRRTAVRAGALVAFSLVAGGVSACSKTGDQAEEAGQFDRLIGTDPQEAWETLVSEGWFPTLKRYPNGGTAGTVALIERNDQTHFSADACHDVEGTLHEELEGTEWQGGLDVWLAGMSQIPPHITGASRTEGVEQLEEAGFTDVQVVEEGDVDASRNRVKACDPAPISWALLDEEVTLTITSDVEMPDLVGMTPVDASAALIRAGLVPDPEVLTNEGYYGRNPVVTSTSVPAGSTVRVGDTIVVEYSEPVS